MAEKNMLKKNLTVALLLTALLSACATAPGNYLDTSSLHEKSASTATENYPVQLIDADLILTQAQAVVTQQMLPPAHYADPAQYVYRVEPQDILGITVWDHPELTTPNSTTLSTGDNTTQTLAGAVQQPYTTALPGQADPFGQTVAPDGSIFFPFVGVTHVAGQTVGEIRSELTRKLAPYVRNPQLDVRVLSYRSQKVQVTGEVKTPGPLAMSDVPLTLVDAITRSGGTAGDADLQRVRLTRDHQLYVLDANSLLERGDVTQNVMLQPGDIVNVPDRTDSRIFVLGEVKTPMPVSMPNGRATTIADALSLAGGILDTDANPRQIYVMRGMRDKPTQPEVYRLDMTQPASILLSTQFQLQPLDVVYVGTAASATFNRILLQVLPTLQTIFYAKQLTN
jgi:polysaccharide export outer membrane protein